MTGQRLNQFAPEEEHDSYCCLFTNPFAMNILAHSDVTLEGFRSAAKGNKGRFQPIDRIFVPQIKSE